MPDESPLIALTNFTARRSGKPILTNVTFALRQHECWAIIGPTGSGKTTLLQVLAGQFPAQPGSLSRQASAEFVSFKEESSRFSYSGYFYQQRYQATMGDNPEGEEPAYHSIPTVRNYLQFTESPENNALVKRLGLEPLLDRSFLKLSNGQTRKTRIGKALLRHPTILLLDNPFVGLDKTFRAELTEWLGELMNHGLTLALVTDAENIPPFATHVIVLKEGEVQWQGEVKSYAPPIQDVVESPLPILQTKPKLPDFAEAFRLRNVTVRYGETVILNNINWAIQAGEQWALLGQNGAGKSVLLSLLYGDHPQAYANDVHVFGHRRGKSGESIWDVKRRIGFVSPELHLYFPQHLSVRQVALTGLTDTLTPSKNVAPETEADLIQLLTYFGLIDTLNRPFGTLSAGEQRLILLIRALLKNPPVLLLDEPFQVIDAHHIERARRLIGSLNDKTILFVTHNQHELPDSVDQIFDLNAVND
ncbi:ATP-binding cassette domain-containing protein [Spirosoma sp.]|uniref:ATP-binding cassette domain-containing protein n=1 Tax=Spirosoma sp. TaxID=1899569 RepID=UPI003B3AF798